jgi:hypothetical protein
LVIPIAPSLYTLHEGRKVREEGIEGSKLLRALCDLGVKALEFWYYWERVTAAPGDLSAIALAAAEASAKQGGRRIFDR